MYKRQGGSLDHRLLCCGRSCRFPLCRGSGSLAPRETGGIELVDVYKRQLCATLNLYRVSAPLFLEASTGLNDDLNGVERKVTFDIRDSGCLLYTSAPAHNGVTRVDAQNSHSAIPFLL